MILNKLILNNFRVFEGRHTIELGVREGKPIILFGGLNGAGKTTILSAIRLALLGRLAFNKSFSTPAYKEQLAKLINNSAKQSNKTSSVELHFNYVRSGKASSYKVTREWYAGELDIVSISENEQELKELSYEQAQAYLYELVPPGVADLVFFDGEKIAELAEDDSGSVLKSAVSKLLGIDTISQLNEDLRIYIRKAGIAASATKARHEFETLELEKDELMQKAELLRNEADNEYNAIVEFNKAIERAEQVLLSGGGAWASDREQQQARVDELINKKSNLEGELLAELDGAFPLTIAPNTSKLLSSELKKSREKKNKNVFAEEFSKFLPLLATNLGVELDDNKVLHLVQEYSKGANDEVDFDLSIQQEAFLLHQLESAQSSTRAAAVKHELLSVIDSIEHAATNIARAPEREALKTSFDNLRQLEADKAKAVNSYKSKLKEAKDKYQKAQSLAVRLNKLYKDIKSAFGSNDAIERASLVQELLADFSAELTSLRLSELESEFIKSYNKLARKEDLHFKAKIDKDSFEAILIGPNDVPVSKQALSAGEKQIYAIAMLEALGTVSGKKLPVVIDTPLGRLDSKHREKLIKNYFPEASEQVIILSTDTEVNQGYFSELEEKVSKKYEISFNSEAQSSRIHDGYFWANKQLEEV